MFATFNMGVGFVIVVPFESAEYAAKLLLRAGEEPMYLGAVVGSDRGGVTLEGIFWWGLVRSSWRFWLPVPVPTCRSSWISYTGASVGLRKGREQMDTRYHHALQPAHAP